MTTRCGFIALIGRPNAGKSTLLNALLGKKLSITSRKPQTTQHQIRGIHTQDDTQFIFVDTPGLHQTEKGLLNHYLNRAALNALRQVDVIVWLVDAAHWKTDDDYVATKLQHLSVPIIMALNKTDLLPHHDAAIPLVANYAAKWPQIDIIPIAAKHGFQLPRLLQLIATKLPESTFYFPTDQLTDRSDAFLAAEFIREALIRSLGQELPYAARVEIADFTRKPAILHIQAIIWVARDGQKPIVIGEKGNRLKKISTTARLSLERYFAQKVFLQVWVKVKENWSDDERILQNFYRIE